MEDEDPELLEQFNITLTASDGDTALHSNFTAVVFINPSDDPGGVVQFHGGESRHFFVDEGDDISIRYH